MLPTRTAGFTVPLAKALAKEGNAASWLNDVTITNVKDQASGIEELTFAYDKVSLTTTAQAPSGAALPSQTVAYNVNTKVTSTTPFAAATAGTTITGVHPTSFSLTVSGVDGVSR